MASKLALLWPPSEYLQSNSIIVSQCAWSWPRCTDVSNLLDYDPQVHLHALSSIVWNRISKLARLWLSSSHSHGFQVHISNFALSQPPAASPNSLHHGLQLYLQTNSITVCEYSSPLTWSPSRRASLSIVNSGLQVYLQVCSITPSKCISKLA